MIFVGKQRCAVIMSEVLSLCQLCCHLESKQISNIILSVERFT